MKRTFYHVITVTVVTLFIYLLSKNHVQTIQAATSTICGDIVTNTTLTTGNVYMVTCDIALAEGTTLTIEPGVVLKFEQQATLNISGTLTVQGTTVNPVYFTSSKDDAVGGDSNGDASATKPALGDWKTIVFYNNSDDNSLIENGIIRYNGLANCTNVGCDHYGAIRFENASPIIRNITFENNYRNGVEIIGNSWSTDSWDNTTVSYYVIEDLTIPADNVLTIVENMQVNVLGDMTVAYDATPDKPTALVIKPGVVMKFAKNHSLNINGTLMMQGTAVNPIYFTSYQDDTIGGDSNGDGSATKPALGDWKSIIFSNNSDDNSLIENSIIRYNGLANCNAVGCDRYGAIRFEDASPIIRNMTFEKNYRNGVEIAGNTWSTDSWDNTTIPYYVTSDLTIPIDNVLTIAENMQVNVLGDMTVAYDATPDKPTALVIKPGTVMKFTKHHNLNIMGILMVQGTAVNPVYFTSYQDDTVGGDSNEDASASKPALGDWKAIVFYNNSDDKSVIENAIIRYNGIASCSAVGCDYYGAIRLEDASPIIRNMTFENNAINGIEIAGGNWSTDNWNNIGVPYYVTNNLTLPLGQRLTMMPGMVVKFNPNTNLFIYGELVAAGTQTRPIKLTSYRDDSLNLRKVSRAAKAQDWGGLIFYTDSKATLDYVHAYYGNIALYAKGAAISVNHVLLVNNIIGLQSDMVGTAIQNSLIMSNTSYGVKNNLTSTLDATNNWWGAVSGPNNTISNPKGMGNKVSNSVEYSPWRMEDIIIDTTFTIMGKVVDKNNTPIAEATLTLNNGTPTSTDALGQFQFINLITGTYIFTPSRTGYLFSPTSRTITVPPIATEQNFTEIVQINVYLPVIMRR